MTGLLTKLLGPPQEIGARGHCSSHLYRWTLVERNQYKVYLEHSIGGTVHRDLGSYPKRFVSVGLADSRDGKNFQSLPDDNAWMLLIGSSS